MHQKTFTFPVQSNAKHAELMKLKSTHAV